GTMYVNLGPDDATRAANAKVIRDWISQGALETATSVAPTATFTAAPFTMRRLTSAQYQNAAADILGAVTFRTPLPGATLARHFLTNTTTATTTSSAAEVEQLEAAARDLASQAFDPTRRAAFVGCTPTNPADTCVDGFLKRVGKRTYRRPLTTA